MSSPIEKLFHQAEQAKDRAEQAGLYRAVVDHDVEEDNADDLRLKESAVHRLGDHYSLTKQADQLQWLLLTVRSLFTMLPKAKTAKMIRRIFDQLMTAGARPDVQITVCNEMIDWAKEQKQTFLRHRLQLRLAHLQHVEGDAANALSVINPLLKEVRRLEDRALLVDTHLLESKVYHSIKNHSKARASLVAARTNANSIYCPPLQQATIDMQSGVLNAEDNDYKTAYSYLFEAFEGFHGLGDHCHEARLALKYMILAKILSDAGDELKAVLSAKSVLEYRGDDIDALRDISAAYKKKDTHAFNAVREKYAEPLSDPVTQRHLSDMYDQLLEGHLLRIIEPYNRVQLEFLAATLKLPVDVIEARLSQMILDKKLSGIVDQQHMCLVVYEEDHPTALYDSALTALDSLDKLVNALFDKVSGKFDRMIEEQKKVEEEKQKKKDEKKKEAEKEVAGKK